MPSVVSQQVGPTTFDDLSCACHETDFLLFDDVAFLLKQHLLTKCVLELLHDQYARGDAQTMLCTCKEEKYSVSGWFTI